MNFLVIYKHTKYFTYMDNIGYLQIFVLNNICTNKELEYYLGEFHGEFHGYITINMSWLLGEH